MSDSAVNCSAEIQYLNGTGCIIKRTPDRGRGVYASRFIPRNTLIDISPVLLFSKEEYEKYGRHTALDHYTFIWTGKGRMALALGLGSIFNHDETPNVSYALDTMNDSIRYTTTRDVNVDEELCIYYGQKLWFTPSGQATPIEAEVDDGWGGMADVSLDGLVECNPTNPYAEGDQDEIISEEDLPFVRFRLPPDEEDADSIKTVDAWVVDVPQPRHITTLLKWLKQAGLDGPELGHLKRIRKQKETTTLLLSATSETPELPELPGDLDLPAPYILPIPTSSALTPTSLTLKSALWPTMYTPRRKDEPEPWSRGKLRWAWDAMKGTLEAVSQAHAENEELPVAALISAPYGLTDDENTDSSSLSFLASDTRHSTRHPLRHAAINVVRKMADYRASQDPEVPISEKSISIDVEDEESRNGTNYLLTDRTVFITHEPCIMCSMALLHSRVKEVIYLYPMPQTGGCGGCACLPTLKGVNHRFSILQWKLEHKYSSFMHKTLELDPTIDA